MSETNPCCENCAFVTKDIDNQYHCHRYPPQMHVRQLPVLSGPRPVFNLRSGWKFPTVYPGSWCGEHKPSKS